MKIPGSTLYFYFISKNSSHDKFLIWSVGRGWWVLYLRACALACNHAMPNFTYRYSSIFSTITFDNEVVLHINKGNERDSITIMTIQLCILCLKMSEL